ncbi:hypothetical protein [Aliiroseovarius sp.]|uniref:hypothetical protein n=1 Tax=Aliiroseovarius sp. TaxID=1872442 RepID=UPI003BAB0717
MADELRLAFYKGKGTWVDQMIRWGTRSPYSHVELVQMGMDMPNGVHRAWAISSSWRDGGVRAKVIDFEPDRWDWIELRPWYPAHLWDNAHRHFGAKYDLVGIALSQIVALRRHDPDRWFCSEFIGMLLGYDRSHALAPGDLATRVAEMNFAFQEGRSRQIDLAGGFV